MDSHLFCDNLQYIIMYMYVYNVLIIFLFSLSSLLPFLRNKTHKVTPIRVLNSLHGSHLGHNILLFVERLSSCVTRAKNTTPPLPTPLQLPLLPSLPLCLPARLTLCFSTSASDPRGGGWEGGRNFNPGCFTDFSGQE